MIQKDITTRWQQKTIPVGNKGNRLIQTYVIFRYKLGLLYLCSEKVTCCGCRHSSKHKKWELKKTPVNKIQQTEHPHYKRKPDRTKLLEVIHFFCILLLPQYLTYNKSYGGNPISSLVHHESGLEFHIIWKTSMLKNFRQFYPFSFGWEVFKHL